MVPDHRLIGTCTPAHGIFHAGIEEATTVSGKKPGHSKILLEKRKEMSTAC